MININKTPPDKHPYTTGLASIDKPPKVLYYCGTLPKTRLPTVAIVGSRKPTAYGKDVTRRLAYDYAKAGLIVVKRPGTWSG